MLNVAMIGCGAIGIGVLELLRDDSMITVSRVVVPEASVDRVRPQVALVAPQAQLASCLGDESERPDLLLECAGHKAIEEHVLPALERGIPCMVVSVGALSEPLMVKRLETATMRGMTQVQLLSGAIGAIDALAAAKIGGLHSVVYTGRKPPHAWKETPAEALFDLKSLDAPTVIFEGTACDAARLYPKNANVSATLALAGLGLDRTQVRLLADPSVRDNVHHVEVKGEFGDFELTMHGKPLAANPKTSALTVLSVVRALRNRAYALAI